MPELRFRDLLASEAKTSEEGYMANATPTRGLKRSSTFRNYKTPEPRFRALLAEGTSGVQLALS
jgi:hypothetical protein